MGRAEPTTGWRAPAAADLLARDEQELARRPESVVAAETTAVAERERVGALAVDFTELEAQLHP